MQVEISKEENAILVISLSARIQALRKHSAVCSLALLDKEATAAEEAAQTVEALYVKMMGRPF